MNRAHRSVRRGYLAVAIAAGAAIGASTAAAQDADPRPRQQRHHSTISNTIAGEFTPGTGFDIIETRSAA